MTHRKAQTDPPLLVMSGISKSFPGVQALNHVSLNLNSGEVLALLGENGAGKSTLMKVLGGVHRPDNGSIQIDGQTVDLASPTDAFRSGIGVIHQEFNLIPELTAWENIFLGHEQRYGLVDRRGEQTRAQQLFDRLGIPIPLDAPCRQLSVAKQQLVEIAKALSQDVRILVMDEPTAALTPQETERLFAIVKDLKQQGIGIVYISHRLDEIFALADRISVLRDGRNAGDVSTAAVSRAQLIEMMVGRPIDDEFPAATRQPGEPRLTVTDLRRGDAVRGVSFSVRRGEVLGITGLVGSGRTELVRLIFGADLPDDGQIELDGRVLRLKNPADAIQAGICLLTEDRKSQGLIQDRSVRENFGLPNVDRFSRGGFLKLAEERRRFAEYVSSLSIRIPHQDQVAAGLSGGNQQKVVLAKWLERQADVLIFDEPTRGVDVGARHEIYQLINQLAADGRSIIIVSSELPEVLGVSDRILVMHEGRISGELMNTPQTTQEQIMELAIGESAA